MITVAAISGLVATLFIGLAYRHRCRYMVLAYRAAILAEYPAAQYIKAKYRFGTWIIHTDEQYNTQFFDQRLEIRVNRRIGTEVWGLYSPERLTHRLVPHRKHGPAVTHPDGEQFWYERGSLKRQQNLLSE